jgi:hypothetical protein
MVTHHIDGMMRESEVGWTPDEEGEEHLWVRPGTYNVGKRKTSTSAGFDNGPKQSFPLPTPFFLTLFSTFFECSKRNVKE